MLLEIRKIDLEQPAVIGTAVEVVLGGQMLLDGPKLVFGFTSQQLLQKQVSYHFKQIKLPS